MGDVMKDSRFSHISQDPRFRKIPKREKKIKIDKRFQSMFKDKNFKVNYRVDKRGRPVFRTSNEDLKKFYALSSDEDKASESESGSDDESEESEHSSLTDKEQADSESGRDSSCIVVNKEKTVQEKKKDTSKIKIQRNLDDDSTYSEESSKEGCVVLTENVKEKLRDLTVDYARGEGVLFSDSSSDEENSEEDSDEEEFDHGWGELDHDAEKTDEVTNRLAVCNMNWDRIRASDLMVLFNSFVPKEGVIHSIMIYPSEFGMKRLEEEEVKGPLELVENNAKRENEDEEEKEEGSSYNMEKLRQYQLNRLKYYYAVLVCDSPATANKIYTECDGLEYESSATRLDLRFIPNDTTFDQEPREVCNKLPELSKYTPRFFTTTALQQVKVDLTWDETNPDRKEINEKLKSGQVDGITDADLRNYLAVSSEDESAVESDNEERNDVESETDDDPVSKYRSLLKEIEEQEEKKKSRDVEMEITWDIGLKDKTEQLVQKKLKEKQNDLTPFEKYIEKRKEKKKQKKQEKLNKIKKDVEGSDNEYSDDDVPSDIDMNDPFFQEEFQGEFKKKNKTKKKTNEPTDESTQDKAELELLLMNDTEEKKHFSLTSIQEQEALGTKNKKKQRRRKKEKVNAVNNKDDDFEVNVKDDRFSALFSSHHFNIDPTDPHYRKTKAMEALRTEKLSRRQSEMTASQDEVPAKVSKKDSTHNKDPELSLLVKTIKRKTQNLQKGGRR